MDLVKALLEPKDLFVELQAMGIGKCVVPRIRELLGHGVGIFEKSAGPLRHVRLDVSV